MELDPSEILGGGGVNPAPDRGPGLVSPRRAAEELDLVVPDKAVLDQMRQHGPGWMAAATLWRQAEALAEYPGHHPVIPDDHDSVPPEWRYAHALEMALYNDDPAIDVELKPPGKLLAQAGAYLDDVDPPAPPAACGGAERLNRELLMWIALAARALYTGQRASGAFPGALPKAPFQWDKTQLEVLDVELVRAAAAAIPESLILSRETWWE